MVLILSVLGIFLAILGLIVSIIFGILQLIAHSGKGEVRFSKRFPFITISPEGAVPIETVKKARKKRKKKRIIRKILVPLFVSVALVIALFLLNTLLRGELSPTTIAVMSFDNQTGEGSFDYLSEAIPNLLITDLEQSKYLSVMTWERMHDLLKVMGKEDVEEIDEELGFELCKMEGIEAIVLGSFTKAGEMFATEAKVLDVETKEIRMSTSSKGEGKASILKSQIDELTKDISRGVGLSIRKIEATQHPIAEITTSSMEAYNYFLRGREDWGKFYWDDAKKFLEKAVELDSTFAMAYLYLARTYGSLGETKARDEAYEKAKTYSQDATEKERLYIEAWYASAIERNLEKQFRILKQMVKKYHKEKRVYASLGVYYYGKELYDKAIEEFNNALELDPNFGPAINLLAYSYADIGKYGKAIEYFMRYASVSPGDANPFDSMGDLYFRMGQLDNALAKYKEAIEAKPDFMSSLKIAYMYALREDYSKAMKWIHYHISMAQSSGIKAEGYWQKAFYSFLLGNFDHTLNNLDTADYLIKKIEWQYGRESVDWFRALVYYDMKKYELSRNYQKAWYTYDPSQPDYAVRTVSFNFSLGLIDLKQEKLDSARVMLAKIKSFLPDVELEDKDYALFLHDLLYTELLFVQDSLGKAIAVFEKTSKLIKLDEPPGKLIGIYNIRYNRDIVARAYYKKGDIDRAILEYERLTSSDPNKRGRLLIHPIWHYELAKLYEERSLKDEAIEQYEKFLDIWKDADEGSPELIDARKRLAKLKATS